VLPSVEGYCQTTAEDDAQVDAYSRTAQILRAQTSKGSGSTLLQEGNESRHAHCTRQEGRCERRISEQARVQSILSLSPAEASSFFLISQAMRIAFT